jgi:hypothetical protein
MFRWDSVRALIMKFSIPSSYFYLCVLHPVAYLSNWFFMTPPKNLEKNLEDRPDHHEEIQIRHIKSVHSSYYFNILYIRPLL